MRSAHAFWLRRTLSGLLLTGLIGALAMGMLPARWLADLDRQVYDQGLALQPPVVADRVVIVDIDERSLAEIGRWPWDRSVIARLADRLDAAGASVIGFDILFAETQATAGEDEALAATLRRTPTVLGYYFTSDRGGRVSGRLPTPVFAADTLEAMSLPVTDWSGYGANLGVFQRDEQAAGFFNPFIDDDGVVRRLPLLARHEGQAYESLAVAVLRRYLGSASLVLSPGTMELRGSRGVARLPLSRGLSALVPFGSGAVAGRSHESPFESVSASDVLRGHVGDPLFKDRIVLIGTSAPGLSDLRATPVSTTSPGVGIHATLIAGALSRDDPPRVRTWSEETARIGALLTVAVGVALSIALPALGAVGVVSCGLIAIAALLAAHLAWIQWAGWVVPIGASWVLVLALCGLNLALGYFIEGRARRQVADLFGEYVSPELVERMNRDPLRFRAMTSENRELTILFADIRGFTRIAESMEPADLREFINEFLTAMTEVIHRHHGTVDKYIGDAVMAFWGAPMDDECHADHAVDAARAMVAEVVRLNRAYARRGWPTLAIGVGINTGIARVGDMGSRLRRTYTVLGDAVNLASRIESLTKQFGVPIIVGEATVERARGHAFGELAVVNVVGRHEAVRVFVPGAIADRGYPLHTAAPGADHAEDDHEVARARV